MQITANSDGGNIKIDIAGMIVTRVSAETGGGNVNVVLPDIAANLSVTASTGGGNVNVEIGRNTKGSNKVLANSGAGNVIVLVPDGITAQLNVNSGMGKVIVNSKYNKIDNNTYQSPDYEDSVNKVEITAKSGAGNVIIDARK